jgi:DNA-binding NarL/FixJ family response regulator
MKTSKSPAHTGRPRRVLIVDDHPIVRQGLRSLVEQEVDLTVCGEAGSAAEALKVLTALKPDLLLVDISLKGPDGLELTKSVRALKPGLPILIVSMHDESLYAERVLRAGANGYIMKEEVAENVVGAARKVLAGDIYISDRMRQQILRGVAGQRTHPATSSIERLSDRELEVFRLIGQGHGTRQIAEDLHLSVKTIETYRAHIKEKMGLPNATSLVRQAVQWVEQQHQTT